MSQTPGCKSGHREGNKPDSKPKGSPRHNPTTAKKQKRITEQEKEQKMW
jgi:hypothetical protein